MIDDDQIENTCDDLRIAMQDLLCNGPNTIDYARAIVYVHDLERMVNELNTGWLE